MSRPTAMSAPRTRGGVKVVVFDEPQASLPPSKRAKAAEREKKNKEQDTKDDEKEERGFDMAKMVEEARADVARLAAADLVGEQRGGGEGGGRSKGDGEREKERKKERRREERVKDML